MPLCGLDANDYLLWCYSIRFSWQFIHGGDIVLRNWRSNIMVANLPDLGKLPATRR